MRDDLLSKAISRTPRSIRFKGRAFTTSWAGAEMYVGEPRRAAAYQLDKPDLEGRFRLPLVVA